VRFFDDLNVGDRFESPGKTIAETAVTLCVGLAGMTLSLFNDVEYARKTQAGGFIVPGRMVLMMMGGLEEQTLLWEPSVLLVELRNVRFLKPVMLGDTIHVELEILEKRESRGKRRGIVIHRSRCETQRGNLVLECENVHLVAKRAESAHAQPLSC
jgi:acyl dehydratase